MSGHCGWAEGQCCRLLRDHSRHHCQVPRTSWICPGCGELYYIHMLLNVAKSTSYEDLRTVAGVMYPTFKMLLRHLAFLETTMSGVRLLEKYLSGDQLPKWSASCYYILFALFVMQPPCSLSSLPISLMIYSIKSRGCYSYHPIRFQNTILETRS